MKAQEIYKKAEKNGVEFETTCANISEREWEKLYEKSTRADKKKVEKLIKEFFASDWFKFRNPYPCYKTKTHIIYIHSATDYFFRIL